MQISNGWIKGTSCNVVFDEYAPVTDFSTVRLLISHAFGNKWEMFQHLNCGINASINLLLT